MRTSPILKAKTRDSPSPSSGLSATRALEFIFFSLKMIMMCQQYLIDDDVFNAALMLSFSSSTCVAGTVVTSPIGLET